MTVTSWLTLATIVAAFASAQLASYFPIWLDVRRKKRAVRAQLAGVLRGVVAMSPSIGIPVTVIEPTITEYRRIVFSVEAMAYVDPSIIRELCALLPMIEQVRKLALLIYENEKTLEDLTNRFSSGAVPNNELEAAQNEAQLAKEQLLKVKIHIDNSLPPIIEKLAR